MTTQCYKVEKGIFCRKKGLEISMKSFADDTHFHLSTFVWDWWPLSSVKKYQRDSKKLSLGCKQIMKNDPWTKVRIPMSLKTRWKDCTIGDKKDPLV